MNPLLATFVPEARDLLQAAASGLLRLERSTGDRALVNEVFRAVHTIKGSSGLFDAAALTRVVHAGEDLLDGVRAGRVGLTPEMVDLLLDSLDQAGRWIDSLEREGRLPGDADSVARRIAAGLRARMSADAAAPAADGTAEGAGDVAAWLHTLDASGRDAAAGGGALLSVRYAPDVGCFYRGEDPLNLFRQVPDLLALHVTSATAWPAADELDPYRCNLVFQALTAAPLADVEHMFRFVADQVEITALPAAPETGGGQMLQRIIAGQRRILGMPAGVEETRQRIAAAAGALGNLIHAAGLPGGASALATAVAEASRDASPAPLLALLDRFSQPAQADGLPEARQAPGGDVPAAPARPSGDAAGEARPAARVLKVDQSRIDQLMNLIGELVVSKNALPFLARRAEEVHGCREMAREIKEQYAVINRLAQEMQGAIMQVSMIPVSEVFDRFPRLVRDIARKLDKQVELVIDGGDAAADKAIIEALGDPLLHIVRNALDHGVESPSQRKQAGKPPHGTLRLAAHQDGDQVVIEVSDDGHGIDPARIRQSAIDKGVVDASQAARLSDQEAVNLIFHAGFSTASEISDLSGRGVGMDVVRTTADRLGGSVGVTSRPGEGTCVRLSLPLSMAVTHVMMVEVCGTLFGIPMDAVAETVRVPRDRIRKIRQAEAFVLRDAVVPLVRLADLLGMDAASPMDASGGNAAEAVLVVRVAGATAGLVVDRFREGNDVILKPLDGILAGLPGYAGTALLGDGRVLPVLNLKELM